MITRNLRTTSDEVQPNGLSTGNTYPSGKGKAGVKGCFTTILKLGIITK